MNAGSNTGVNLGTSELNVTSSEYEADDHLWVELIKAHRQDGSSETKA